MPAAPNSTPTRSQFRGEFIARIRAAREASGRTQGEMAYALGIPLANYEKYEGRSPLPHHLIGRFAEITRVSLDYLFLGRGPPPVALRAAPPSRGPAGKSPAKKRLRRKTDNLSESLL